MYNVPTLAIKHQSVKALMLYTAGIFVLQKSFIIGLNKHQHTFALQD